MRILPVLDLMNGVVVRGIAGRRHEYRPIVSRLTASTSPLDVARAFREGFGLTELYVADLDAIAGRPPALAIFGKLQADGFHLWVDAGVKDLEVLEKIGVQRLVAGLESLAGPQDLMRLLERFPELLVFSLDLHEGTPLGQREAWDQRGAESLARYAIELGINRILVLDLAGVGVNEGSKTLELCRRLREAFPKLEITTGGGVRNEDDLLVLEFIGVDYALVASALHDGRLSPNPT